MSYVIILYKQCVDQDLIALVEEMSKTFQQETKQTPFNIDPKKKKKFLPKCLQGVGKDEKGKIKKNVIMKIDQRRNSLKYIYF